MKLYLQPIDAVASLFTRDDGSVEVEVLRMLFCCPESLYSHWSHINKHVFYLPYMQTGLTSRKVNRHVEFPLLLDLAPYCSSLSVVSACLILIKCKQVNWEVGSSNPADIICQFSNFHVISYVTKSSINICGVSGALHKEKMKKTCGLDSETNS